MLAAFAVITPAFAQVLLPPDPSVSIGKVVPLAGFVDEQDQPFAAIADGRPWIVSPVYARCKSTCSPLTAGLRKALDRSGLDTSEYRVASFSFDPRETAEQLRTFRAHLELPRTWLTLRAVDQADLARTLAALDFRTITTDDGEFEHPNLIAILTPDLRLAGYLFGVEFSPTELADVVRRAQTGAIGSQSRWLLFLAAVIGFGINSGVFVVLIMRRRRAAPR